MVGVDFIRCCVEHTRTNALVEICSSICVGILWSNNGQIFFVVIKTTEQRHENYLVSFRRARISDLKKDKTLTAEEKEKLGVA